MTGDDGGSLGADTFGVADGTRTIVAQVALAAVLAGVIAGTAPGAPEWLNASGVALLFVAFAAIGVVRDAIRTRDWLFVAVQLVLTALLWAVVERQRGAGIPETDRALQVGLVVVLLLAYPFVKRLDAGRFLRAAPFVLGGALVVGIHLHHVVDLYPGSGLASFPIFAAVVASMCLFVVPQHVSRRGFFRVLSLVAAGVVLVGLWVYVDGRYEFLGLTVRLTSSKISNPLVPMDLFAMRSVFPNPNGFGLLTFGGTFAAFVWTVEALDAATSGEFPIGDGGVEPGRTEQARPGGQYERSTNRLGTTRPTGTRAGRAFIPAAASLAIAASLFLVNSIGLLLSDSRASLLAFAVAGTVYGAYVAFGRAVVPGATLAAVLVVGLFLLAVATSIVPVNPGKRFALWSGALSAYLAEPSLFGQGIVSTSNLLEPFVVERNVGLSPHNSYLVILLRAGLIGLVGYLVLVIGSVVGGLAKIRSVDVAALAFATGWAIHQLFEAYTLFHFTTGAVLSALAVGFLVASIIDADDVDGGDADAPQPGSLGDTFR